MLMKMTKFLSVLTAALMLSLSFTSCEELEGLEGGENNETADSQAFFPKDYSSKKVAAWYELTEKKDNGIKTEAVFLFEDGTFVTTKSRVYTDGRDNERSILAAGTYKMQSGDYTNGKAEVVFVGEEGNVETMLVEIRDGKMTAMGEVFTKQDNAKLPKATDPTGEGGENHGGNQGDALEAFFPTDYANKTVKAWYKYSDVITVTDNDHPENPGYEMKFTAAFYFFDDNLFIATTHTLLYGPNGSEIDQRLYSYIGKYEILDGDFNNGKIKIYITEDKYVTIELKNGQLIAADADDGGEHYVLYDKQDNAKLPEPSEPTEGYNPGDDQGDEIDAFFPTTFAKKTVVAWYTYSVSAPGESQVEAVFLFDDNTMAVTEHKVHPEDAQNPEERYIMAYGTYSLSGNYDNGSVEAFLHPAESKMRIDISNGNLTLAGNSSMVYIKRDLDDIPSALDPTGGYIPDLNDNPEGGDGDSKLAAWYSGTITQDGVEYTVDIILLSDNTVAFAQTRVAAEGSDYQYMTEIIGVGQYKITSGDLTDGTVVITMFGEPKEFKVSNGMVTVMQDGQTVTYYKQDNSKYNGPTDFSDYGDDDGDDDDDYSQVKAYLPADFASKEISAWYMLAEEESNSVRIEAVFLFTDNTLVVTKTKVYAKSDGRDPAYTITAYGQYRITEGDYYTGKASVVTEDGKSFEVVIEDGIMTAMGAEFNWMSLNYIPELTTNGK